MTITTEEAEALAGTVWGPGLPMNDARRVANALRALVAEREFLAAKVAQIEGAAEGTLTVLEKWKARAERAEAEAERLREDCDRMKRSRDRYREEWQRAKDHQEVAASNARAALEGGDNADQQTG